MARNKYPEETKNLIIKTASTLFLEQGYEHTSIQDIIDHLGGLSKGAIYHHFKSKEDIMMAVAERMYSGSDYGIREICKRTDLNGKEKIRLVFRQSFFSPGQEKMFTVAPDMIKNSQLLVYYLQDTVQKEAPDILQSLLEEGIQDGSIRTEYPKELAEVIMLVTNIWLNPMVYHCTIQELAKKMEFLRHMLCLFGLDVIDDDVAEQLLKYSEIYESKNI